MILSMSYFKTINILSGAFPSHNSPFVLHFNERGRALTHEFGAKTYYLGQGNVFTGVCLSGECLPLRLGPGWGYASEGGGSCATGSGGCASGDVCTPPWTRTPWTHTHTHTHTPLFHGQQAGGKRPNGMLPCFGKISAESCMKMKEIRPGRSGCL